jgi:glutathione S-transferase
MKITITVGTKNWSSWSLRGWLPVKLSGLPFEERYVRLRQTNMPEMMKDVSPSGLVPLLTVEDGGHHTQIWDSLAIAEFMAEIAPDARLWPKDRMQRARARALTAEMHSGYADLRRQYSMDMVRRHEGNAPEPGTARAIARIQQIWDECLAASGGPYLFGADFGIADAFHAPLVSRFRTYGVTLSGAAERYAAAVWQHPAMQEWLAAAQKEVEAGEA